MKKTAQMKAFDDFFAAVKPVEPTTYDRSDLESTVSCPFMGAAIRNGEVKNVAAIMDIGSECHRILEDAMEVKGDDPQGIAEWLEAEMQMARPDIQPEVIQAMRGVSKTLYRMNASRVIAVEKQFSAELSPGSDTVGAIVCTCCMDILAAGKNENEIIVHDYKAGWKQMSNTEAKNAFQTCHYAWVLFKNYPDVEVIHFWYEQTRFGSRSYARIERGRDFYNFAGRVQSAVQLVESDNREAWPDLDKCSWCPATAICPHVVDDPKELNASPGGFILQLVALQARITKMKTAANAYVKKHGNIQIGKQVYGYQPPEKISNKLFKEKEIE